VAKVEETAAILKENSQKIFAAILKVEETAAILKENSQKIFAAILMVLTAYNCHLFHQSFQMLNFFVFQICALLVFSADNTSGSSIFAKHLSILQILAAHCFCPEYCISKYWHHIGHASISEYS
jgi:hypothetical protein